MVTCYGVVNTNIGVASGACPVLPSSLSCRLSSTILKGGQNWVARFETIVAVTGESRLGKAEKSGVLPGVYKDHGAVRVRRASTRHRHEVS